LGRWLTPDPRGFTAGDVNLYRSEMNNPGNLLDPSGLKPAKCYCPGLKNPSAAPTCKPGDEKIPAEVWIVNYTWSTYGSVPMTWPLRHSAVCAKYGDEIHSFSFNNWWLYDDQGDAYGGDLARCKDPNNRPWFSSYVLKTNKCAVLDEYW